MKQQKNYFLGLDVGTESVGYAVTNDQYDLLKYRGEPMWGVHLFDEAALNDERRAHRSARRRLDRRQQRIRLLQEIFAGEIARIDENFYRRIKESALWREDAQDAFCLFADERYTDADYHKQYPTIHHLIMDLINDHKPHDVRLVYFSLRLATCPPRTFLQRCSQGEYRRCAGYSQVLPRSDGDVPRCKALDV